MVIVPPSRFAEPNMVLQSARADIPSEVKDRVRVLPRARFCSTPPMVACWVVKVLPISSAGSAPLEEQEVTMALAQIARMGKAIVRRVRDLIECLARRCRIAEST